MPRDKYISDFLSKYLDTIKTTYNPKGLWFFGSMISGNAKEESDLDLVLVSDKFKGRKFIYRMGNFLKIYDFPKHLDALCYTPDEFEKKKQEIGIVREAIETGEKII